MKGLAAAIAFLTRLPLRAGREVPPGAGVAWFPLVGAGIGAAVSLVLVGTRPRLPTLAAGGLAVGFGLLLTGAIHEDGLADTFDAVGRRGQEARAIMKDPHVGVFGAAALILSLVVRVSLVGGLAHPVMALPAVHALSRAVVVGVMLTAEPASAEGLAASHLATLRAVPAWLGLVSGVVIGAVLLGPVIGWVLAAMLLPAWALVRWARGAIGGVTGDILGACQQVAEVAGLAVVMAVPR